MIDYRLAYVSRMYKDGFALLVDGEKVTLDEAVKHLKTQYPNFTIPPMVFLYD
jgi:hypothetical protein